MNDRPQGMSVWLYPDDLDHLLGALNRYLDHWDAVDPEHAQIISLVSRLESYKRSKLK